MARVDIMTFKEGKFLSEWHFIGISSDGVYIGFPYI